jgi:uncharacterized protein YegL
MHTLIAPDTLRIAVRLNILVLDASTSMSRFGSAPVDAVHDQVRAFAAQPEARVTAAGLVTFSAVARVVVPVTPVAQFPSRFEYGLSGGTRLFGCTRDILQTLLAADVGAHAQVCVGVITDGDDNASSEGTRLQLVELAGAAARRGFALFTTGVGVDADAVARRMGFPIHRGATATNTASEDGVAESVRFMTFAALEAFRSKPG